MVMILIMNIMVIIIVIMEGERQQVSQQRRHRPYLDDEQGVRDGWLVSMISLGLGKWISIVRCYIGETTIATNIFNDFGPSFASEL